MTDNQKLAVAVDIIREKDQEIEMLRNRVRFLESELRPWRRRYGWRVIEGAATVTALAPRHEWCTRPGERRP